MPAPHITGTVLQQNTRQQYIVMLIETIFIYPFFIPEDQDIDVYVTPAGNTANEDLDIKILNTNYTVQDSGEQLGGTITFLPGSIPGVGDIITLVRNVVDTITTNYNDAQTITGENLDDSFEREMLVTQQNKNNSEQRSLRYQDSAFLPASETRNIVPTLDPNFFWKGAASGGVIAVEDTEEPGCSTLRSELANSASGTDGAGLVGWFDIEKGLSTTVRDQLNRISDQASGQDGAREVGYYNPVDMVETTVGDQLDISAGFPEKLQNGFAVYGDDVGTPNNIVVNIIPSYQGYTEGTKVFVKVANTNSIQAPTLNLNGLGVKTIINKDGTPLLSGDLQANGIYEFIYDGVNFQSLTSPLHNRSQGEFSQLTEVTVVDTTSEIDLLSGTISGTNVIPANYLVPGSAYRFDLHGGYENRFESPINIRFKSNGSTIFNIAPPAPGSTPDPGGLGVIFVPLKITVDFVVRSIGNPSTVYIKIRITQGGQTVNGSWTNYPYVTMSNDVIDTTLFDSEIDNTLTLSFQFNSSNANHRIKIESFNSTKIF
jgi:hypothetical protein